MNLSTLNDIDPEKNDQPAAPEQDPSLAALEEQDTEFVATQPKKPMNQTAMMLFAIITIGAGGLWMMYRHVGPQKAAAADPATVTAQATITDFVQRGSSNVSLLRKLLDGTAKIVEQFKIPNIIQVPLSDLKANPFHFASTKAAPGEDSGEAARKKLEQEKLAIQTAAKSLQLQSLVLRANRKACMINNVLYQEGEVVSGFTIQTISNEGVVVKNGQYRFRLQMSK